MKFFIEQIAIAPKDPVAARKLLDDMGAAQSSWAEDHVVAVGSVFGNGAANEANLSFNYGMGNINGSLEFEILEYTSGAAWVNPKEHGSVVSHFGMHVDSQAELDRWKVFFQQRGIGVAQEVQTQSHVNPVIAGKRWYTYLIFDTREVLGVDLKFILRRSEQ